MNWAGSLGAGPGLLGFDREPSLAALDPAPGGRRRVHRTRAESRALQAEIDARLERGEVGTQIAEELEVNTSYVYQRAKLRGEPRKTRTPGEVQAIVNQAAQMLAATPRPRTGAVAKAVGVSPQYLCLLLSRYAANDDRSVDDDDAGRADRQLPEAARP